MARESKGNTRESRWEHVMESNKNKGNFQQGINAMSSSMKAEKKDQPALQL